jgi:predicted DNA-binding transcriptional regulator YafY
LARRGPIRAYDEHLDDYVELELGQRDPAGIEGLVIDFRYMNRDGEVTRRSLLCWHCGRAGERIYVRGYCPFREELRTFRIDRMADLIVVQGDRETEVDDIRAFFAAFAAARTEAGEVLSLEGPDA